MLGEAFFKRYLPVIIGLMIAAVAFFQAKGAVTLAGSSLFEPTPLNLDIATTQPPQKRHTDGKAILARNPFDSETGPLDGSGIELSAPPPVDAETVDRSRPSMGDPKCDFAWVTLIAAADDPNWSFAKVVDKSGKTALRRIGDEVEKHEVSLIAWNRVWFQDGAGHCQSYLGDKPAKASPRKTRPGTRPTKRKRRRRRPTVPPEIAKKIHRISDTEFKVDRSAVDEVLENQFDLLKSTRLRPIKEGGKVTGMRLSRVYDKSLLHMLGVRTGDVMHSINGFELSDPQKALQAYGRLRTADRLTLSLTRNGKPTNIDIQIQ